MATLQLLLLLPIVAGALRYHDDVKKLLAKSREEWTPSCSQGFDPLYASACPDPQWVEWMFLVDPSPDKVFMDIGCNKGNDAVAWMQRWQPPAAHFWSAKRWIEHYDKKLHINNYACKPWAPDKTRTVHMWKNASSLSTAVCVEPMHNNVVALRNASSTLGYGSSTKFGSFHIVQAAVMDTAESGETVEFPDKTPGAENARLDARSYPVRVPRKTVDQIKHELSLPKVDILTIDTEGADPMVLEGATEALKTTRYLTFEVHRDLKGTAWNRTSLRSVVDKLDDQGFDCFWAGNNGRLLSIKDCWREDFERGVWANAACVRRGDPWAGVLRIFAGS
uniref:Methyltransferase FkbM domain-containing protein n=1 Tax=Alexandrium catenella TaxID=2925 RepID=A0A7S1RQW6_ALECA